MVYYFAFGQNIHKCTLETKYMYQQSSLYCNRDDNYQLTPTTAAGD